MFSGNMQDFLEDRDKTLSVSIDIYGVRMAHFFFLLPHKALLGIEPRVLALLGSLLSLR